MNSKTTKLMITATAIVVPLAILLWFNQDAVWAFLDFVRDRNAISAFIDEIGLIGPLVLMGLIGLQILIPWIPSEPPIIAAGYAYGFASGFLMSWLVSVAATQAVYFLARFAGRPVVERFVTVKALDKWTGIASKGGTILFLIVFMNPLLPTDIMVFVAGLSAIDARRFFVANLLGRMPLVAFLTLVGSNGVRITPAVIVGLTFACVFLLVAWWYYVRERPEAVGGGSDQSCTGPSDRRDDSFLSALGVRIPHDQARGLAQKSSWLAQVSACLSPRA
jgi:uncharacterized membrane protein YdjX (TVP38/TMEM64 family)